MILFNNTRSFLLSQSGIYVPQSCTCTQYTIFLYAYTIIFSDQFYKDWAFFAMQNPDITLYN